MAMSVSILPVVLIESTGLQKALFQTTVVGIHMGMGRKEFSQQTSRADGRWGSNPIEFRPYECEIGSCSKYYVWKHLLLVIRDSLLDQNRCDMLYPE